MSVIVSSEWKAARLAAGKAVRKFEVKGEEAAAALAFTLLNDVRACAAEGFDFAARGGAAAYSEASGIEAGRISKCLTILRAFEDRSLAGEGGIRMLVAEQGPSLNAIWKAAKVLLTPVVEGDDESDGGTDASDVRTFITDVQPIVKRWVKRGMSADELLAEFTAFIQGI